MCIRVGCTAIIKPTPEWVPWRLGYLTPGQMRYSNSGQLGGGSGEGRGEGRGEGGWEGEGEKGGGDPPWAMLANSRWLHLSLLKV